MSGFLEHMARLSAERVSQDRASVSESEMLARAEEAPAPARLSFNSLGFDLIAEVKRRSPAAGRLAADRPETVLGDLSERVQRYALAGAAAVSVLTEPTRFDGSLEHLEVASRALANASVPAMRKDFLVDPYQVLQARAAGAGGILVIMRMLSDSQAQALLDCARDLGLFVLLEAFDEIDLERAQGHVERHRRMASSRIDPGAALLVGINCRDLDTLQVVSGRLEALADRLPSGVPRVAESGMASPADATRIAAAGYDLALVGSALMTSADPASLCGELLAAGRAAARARKD